MIHTKLKQISVFLTLAFCALPLAAHSQTPALKVNPNTGETQAQFAKRTQWWRTAKFGMFIHWGIYSIPNSDHQYTTDMGEWFLSNHKVQVADYEKYAAQFHPTQFNANAWAKLAKDAGMKYVVVTAKHHDGFCMFDSALTDYNVVKATPWHHDPMKDLSSAVRKDGMTFCFYYSYMDWHHPDYLPRRAWDTRPTDNASLPDYDKYMQGQLRELLTNYGPIGGIWFDGGWEHNAAEEESLTVDHVMRSVQPGLMVNNRINIPEDYDTPEQTIPASALPEGRLWETCMTINDDWGYVWNDHDFKSSTDLIQKLCDIAGKGGNFLLNVGPDANGVIPQEEVDRLEQVGAWMKVNGQSIYGTTKSPFKKLPFDGRCTQKGNTLYLQVFHWPDAGLTLTGLKTPVKDAKAVDGGEPLTVTTTGETISISKPTRIDPVATVIQVRLTGAPVVDTTEEAIKPQSDGSYVLTAEDADIHGATAHAENRSGGSDIGYWTNSQDSASWLLSVPAAQAGSYQVALEYACQPDSAGSTYSVAVGDGPGISGTVESTGDWDTYQTKTLPGSVTLTAGSNILHVTPQTMPNGAVMNLRRIVLTPTKEN